MRYFFFGNSAGWDEKDVLRSLSPGFTASATSERHPSVRTSASLGLTTVMQSHSGLRNAGNGLKFAYWRHSNCRCPRRRCSPIARVYGER